MKKGLALILALAMLLVLAACGGSTSSSTPTPTSSSAQSGDATTDWPKKPINVVVPWSAGGDTDFHARLMAQLLGEELGVTVNVTNTVGAGGSIGSTEVKDSNPDGITFLCYDTAIALNEASGVTEFGYEAFSPVSTIAKNCGEFLTVKSDFPCDTIADLIEYSKEHPGEVKLAANTGATSYYVAVKLKELGGDFNIVNGGSSSERVASLIGGHIDVSSHTMGVIAQYLETGELKVLGCMAPERSEKYADISTAKDQGVDIAYDMAYYMLAPKGTDPQIVAKMDAAIKKIITTNKTWSDSIYDSYGEKVFYKNSEETISFMKDERDMYMAYADVFQSGLG